MGVSPDTPPSEQSRPFLPSPPQPEAPAPTFGFPVPSPLQDNPPAYLLLPVYPLQRRRRRRCCCFRVLSASSFFIAVIFSILLLAVAILLLWPPNPELSVVLLRLNRFRITPLPSVSIHILMGLEIKIRNPDFLPIDYSSIVSSIFYRGELLGSVTSAGGRVEARNVSYVDADLHLDGVRVLENAIYLIEDVAKASVEFDVVTEAQGWLPLFFFDLPIKGKFSCIARVNPHEQTISHQDCYPAMRSVTDCIFLLFQESLQSSSRLKLFCKLGSIFIMEEIGSPDFDS
ncbi:hypothetical protein IEQ34_013223 [Dendrobium chrysotoxum]|uniref:Late embryogenesis abundant protein LEA-2 subgroup domain-containing protein n=1 Tax=Dendrobium chrysotoxum TaxID=161865 RepID=A0AAV7GQS4_DENCH|nr:hypothetical protein IEQ34_013223 [Dendrobium chrysotoxum]